MRAGKFVTMGAAAAMLAACAAPGEPGIGPREGIGGVSGAVAGGLLGSQIGDGRGQVVATVVGALAGGLIGGSIGRSLDEQDRQRALEAEYRALAYGQPVTWRSPNSGYYGEVVAYDPYSRGGLQCREYQHTIYIDGRPAVEQGTACQNPDGTWSVVPG